MHTPAYLRFLCIPYKLEKSVFPTLEMSYHDYTDLNNHNILRNVIKYHSPISGVKSASPDLESLHYDFTNLSNRTHGENLQLNIGLYQGVYSGSIFFVCPFW